MDVLDSALVNILSCFFNANQGYQFTSADFTGRLLDNQILISMDGRGRAQDNTFIERLWRSDKYEDIYLRDCGSVHELELTDYFRFYNQGHPRSSLDGQTPVEVYWSSQPE
jgi:putative transposase